MRRILVVISALAFLLPACGSGSNGTGPDVPSNTPPLVMRVDPAAATAGDEITIFGIGFSAAAPSNIVIIGNASVSASTYNLLTSPTDGEAESITATIPAGLSAGEYAIIVVVGQDVSNGNVTITIN